MAKHRFLYPHKKGEWRNPCHRDIIFLQQTLPLSDQNKLIQHVSLTEINQTCRDSHTFNNNSLVTAKQSNI